jgi:hypothetical protein
MEQKLGPIKKNIEKIECWECTSKFKISEMIRCCVCGKGYCEDCGGYYICTECDKKFCSEHSDKKMISCSEDAYYNYCGDCVVKHIKKCTDCRNCEKF